MRGLPGVSPGTRDRVLGIVAELDYVVSPAASALRGATRRVAVVLPRLDSWFSSTVLATAQTTLRAADLDVLLYQVGDRHARTRFFRELPARRKVDAVYLVALPMSLEEEERLDLMGVEVVVAGSRLRDFPSVAVDDVAIGRVATEHLIGLGHTRIGMIRTSDTEGAGYASDRHRREGLLAAMHEHGLGPAPSWSSPGRTACAPAPRACGSCWRSTTRRPRSSATPTTSRSAPGTPCSSAACGCPRTSR